MKLYNFFDKNIFADLEKEAISSPRKRAHLNLHLSYNDPIQKTVIALSRKTYIPPHFHKYDYQKELFIVLNGELKLVVFNEEGVVLKVIKLLPGEIVEILPFTIHTVVCLSCTAQIVEIKCGPFVADESKEIPKWSFSEDNELASMFVDWLESVEVGEKIILNF